MKIIMIFYEKLRIWACAASLLKLSDLEYSEFRRSFLKVSYSLDIIAVHSE